LTAQILLHIHIHAMPVQKRKHAAVEQSAKAQTTIKSFAKVSKVHEDNSSCKKRKTVNTCAVAAPVISRTTKRKREQVSTSEDATVATEVERPQTPPATPRGKRSRQADTSLLATPSRGALASFDKLSLNYQPTEDLASEPEELAQLKDLYSAFLAALSLQYAHQRSALPVDVRTLLPIITGHWKKRNVTLVDLQRLLTVESKAASIFILEDFGRAGIQVVRTQTRATKANRINTYIDEVELSAVFGDMLAREWRQVESSAGKENHDGKAFLAQIPLFPITVSESAQKAAPLFNRGQQRLADLRAGPATTPLPATEATPLAGPGAASTTNGAQHRSTALLDRILAKQTLLASRPSGPSKAALERRAALHRIEDVSRVLTLLASANKGGRCSLSLSAAISQIQQSLRNPINAVEVERCLDLMANEITPGFVRIVRTAEVAGVVVARNASVAVAELRARVQRAAAEEEKL
jgi:hypothetical protein